MFGDRSAAVGGNRFMDGASGEPGLAPPEQPQLAVGIKAAMPDPAAQEMIFAGKPNARHGGIFLRVRSKNPFDDLRRAVAQFLVGIEAEDPIAGRFLDG